LTTQFTVSSLARKCGLSRSAVLYYESIGLLAPAKRSAANYRGYGERELRRLEQICSYRDAGLKLADIRALLDLHGRDRPGSGATEILKRRLASLNVEIETLHEHQRSILRLMQNRNYLKGVKTMTKEKWTSIMKAAGFSEADMTRWHVEFERSAPEDHQQFLEFLHILPDEVRSIREWSRNGGVGRH